MNELSMCRNYCEKANQCLKDAIEDEGLASGGVSITDNLKVAFPDKVKSFDVLAAETHDRLFEDVMESPEGESAQPDEDFVWGEALACSEKSGNLGRFAIETQIGLDSLRTTTIDNQ